MKVVVNLPEDEVERLGGVEAAARGLQRRLTALPVFEPGQRVLVLGNNERVAMEKVLGVPLETAEQLYLAVKRLAFIEVGGIERPLTLGEAARVKAYAVAHGLTTQQASDQLLNPIIDLWLERQ